MEKYKLNEVTGGWFIGDFEPSLHKTTDFEIACKTYDEGCREPAHFHKIATEFTLIVDGTARMSGKLFSGGDIVKILPGEATDFEAITNVTTVVVKVPSPKNDKYILK